MTRSEVVDCPECYRTCDWCSWYVHNARVMGCGASGHGKKPRKCEKGQVLKGTVCALCHGRLKVQATTTYETLP